MSVFYFHFCRDNLTGYKNYCVYYTEIWFMFCYLVNNRDKLELKAINDGSVSYAALERKAEIYDKLVRGELSDEEENEKYCVDFFGKRLEEDGSQKAEQCRDSSGATHPQNEDGDNADSVTFNVKPVQLGRTAVSMDNDEHKRFVR